MPLKKRRKRRGSGPNRDDDAFGWRVVRALVALRRSGYKLRDAGAVIGREKGEKLRLTEPAAPALAPGDRPHSRRPRNYLC